MRTVAVWTLRLLGGAVCFAAGWIVHGLPPRALAAVALGEMGAAAIMGALALEERRQLTARSASPTLTP